MSDKSDGKNVFWSDAMVASKTKRGAVELRFNGAKLQVDTETARTIAHGILEAAATADIDAAVFAFGYDNIAKEAADENEKMAIAGGLVDQVRQYRIKLEGEQ